MTRSGDHGAAPIVIGDEFDVDVLRVAHGGHMIGHHAGRTIFIRHALPGERCTVKVTDVNRRIIRADAIDILQAVPQRVSAPCSWSGPDGCGGCDFQHVDLATQRALKSEVLTTSLRRFGGLDDPAMEGLDAEVRELPGHSDGLRWRTRVSWAKDDDGTVGLRRHHRHSIIPVDHCLLALADRDEPSSVVPRSTIERVHDRTWTVTQGSFWQVHPALPEALVDAVLDLGAPVTGETWWDLYAGAGLFAAFLGERVGAGGSVLAVESSVPAVESGREALRDLPQVHVARDDVSRWLSAADHEAPDGVVLDPPRTGVGRELMAALCEAEIPRLVYVACDPVALARDIGVAREWGYGVSGLRAFDGFPMTHHFETVALITRA